MRQETQTKPPGKHHSVRDYARALARVLADEFGTPFVFYESANGAVFWTGEGERHEDRSDQAARSAPLDPPLLAALLGDGRPRVLPKPDGGYRLALLIQRGEKPVLVAVGEVSSLAASGPDVREQERLQNWLQAVVDRLRLSDQL